MFFPTRIN